MISWSPRRRVSVAALIVALALAAACGSSNPTSPGATPAVNSSSSTNPGTGTSPTSGATSGSTGTLRVMMKDTPFTEASAVLVGFSAVSVHRSAGVGTDTGEWTTISTGTSSITCDLMKLRDGPTLVGMGTIAAGHYTQIRLSIAPIPLPTSADSMSVALYQGGTRSSSEACVAGDATAMAPTGATSGPLPVTVPSGEIKLNHQFDVSAGTTLTITLDFDGNKSIHETGHGTYMMSPVIGIVSVVVGT
jgi:Domain of unknown function (DUF4382)